MHPADLPGPFVFVDDLDAPELASDDDHHLRRVLRIRPGEPIIVGDGVGSWRAAILPDGGQVTATGPVLTADPPAPTVTVGFALVKGDKPELIVQKLTELGIDRIVPFRAERSIVQWDPARAARAEARLRAVARAAAMQSHRAHLPRVDPVADLRELVAEGAAFADRSGAPLCLDLPFVLIGPEGGWTDAERGLGAPTVRLGDHVLRAETAAVTAGALLAALRSGLVTASGTGA